MDGVTKDLWTRPVPGSSCREHNDRSGKGKRWLTCWTDPAGKETSRVFRTQAAANAHWKRMEPIRNVVNTMTLVPEKPCSVTSGSGGSVPAS
jgi:hypothetical protein